MSNIATMDALEALTPSQVITVGDNSNTWELREDGKFVRDGFALDPAHFAGEVARGRVTLGARPEAGQFWSDEGHPNYGYAHVLLERADTEGHWWAARMIGGAFQSIVELRTIPGRLIVGDSIPPYVAPAHSMGRLLRRTQRESQQYRSQVLELTRERDELRRGQRTALIEYRTRLQESLHTFMEENDMDGGSALGDLMAEHEMARPNETVKVTVSVTARTYVSIDSEDLEKYAPEGANVTSDAEVYIHWTLDMDTTADVEHGSCACDAVSQSDVRELLREKGHEPSRFSYESTCENC